MLKISDPSFKEGWHALLGTGGQTAYFATLAYLMRLVPAPGDAAPGAEPTPEDVSAPKAELSPGAIARAPALSIPVGTIIPQELPQLVGCAGTAPMGGALRPLSEYSLESASNYRVALHPDGTFTGFVIVPEAGFEQVPGPVQLLFLRDGAVVARTVSSADGRFFVSGLTLGEHTVIASGPAGHAAFAFEVLPAAEELPPLSRSVEADIHLVSARARKEMPVGFQAAVPTDLVVVLIPPTLMPGVREVVLNAYAPAPPMAGAGFGPAGFGPPMAGGFGGGGGFGSGVAGGGMGGFGGLGALLGIGGLAAGIAAIASEDNGFTTPISSP
jgi:hypothetical protein